MPHQRRVEPLHARRVTALESRVDLLGEAPAWPPARSPHRHPGLRRERQTDPPSLAALPEPRGGSVPPAIVHELRERPAA